MLRTERKGERKMKHRLFLRVLAVILSTSLVFGGCAAGAKETGKSVSVSVESKTVTLGEAADYLLAAASKYNKNMPEKAELIDNFEGLKEGDNASRIQALIMVSKAFGELPTPVGNSERLAPKDVDLSGVPEWAQGDLEKLKNAGVLAQSDLSLNEETKEGAGDMAGGLAGKENSTTVSEQTSEKGVPEDATESDTVKDTVASTASDSTENSSGTQPVVASNSITKKELENIVHRIYALYGVELKDDFYAAVNKNALETKEIPAGETDAGGTYDQTVLVGKQIRSILEEIVEGSGYAPGSMEQKIKDFYLSAVDFQKRNALGAEPIKKYMDAIDQASNLQELTDAQILSLKEIGCGGLLAIMYMTDTRDTKKMIATLMPPIEPMNYGDDENHMVRLLILSGEQEAEAKEHVKAYLELEKKIQGQGAESEPQQYVSMEELQALLPGMDVKAIIEASGDEIPKELSIMTPALFESFGKLMQDEKNLPAIKTALKLGIIVNTYTYLSKDFLDVFDEYNQQSMGQAPSENSPEDVAYAMVQNNLGDYVDRLYVQRYFPEEAKKDVENMVQQFIEVYKERIQKLDWMSEETKKAAIRKLDSMKFFIGYPDEWSDYLDSLEITDNFFENMVASAKLSNRRNREEAAAKNRGELGNYMKIPAATVNAYYDQYTNTMCFPAGILQSPSYDVNASLEENLGKIGTVIAHEISHAFDNTGAKFDENGLQKDWWTKEDYEKFEELCDKAAAFYDGWESAAGIKINGTQTLGENIADIGGVGCALEVLKKTENPDYDKFFRAYAEGWLKCTTRARAESLAEVDEHSPSNLRVNRVLANFQEFYDTYKVQPGDGMYVAPEDRISIW